MTDKTRSELQVDLAHALQERDAARTLSLPLTTLPGFRRQTVKTVTTRTDQAHDQTVLPILVASAAAIGFLLGVVLFLLVH